LGSHSVQENQGLLPTVFAVVIVVVVAAVAFVCLVIVQLPD